MTETEQEKSIKILNSYATSILSNAEELAKLASSFSETVGSLKPNHMKNEDKVNGIKDDLELMQAKMAQVLQAVQFAGKAFPEEEGLTDDQPILRERSALRDISDLFAAEEKSDNFSEFLSTIGNAIVSSQEALDERSLSYLQSIRDRPFIPPTLFRIPKISAALKVGLQRSTSNELNVLIASRKDQMDKLNEQTINFEISAVPPTPELLKTLEDQAPRIEFLFNSAGRKAIFDALEAKSDEEDLSSKLRPQLKRMIEPEHQKQVLIWPLSDGQTFILLFAGENSEEDVAIWYFNRQEDQLVSIIRGDLRSKFDEDQNPLRLFVLNMGKSQAGLL